MEYAFAVSRAIRLWHQQTGRNISARDMEVSSYNTGVNSSGKTFIVLRFSVGSTRAVYLKNSEFKDKEFEHLEIEGNSHAVRS